MADTSVNKVILIGRLGDVPDLKYTPSGKAVANLSLATARGGQKGSDEPFWHRVVVWGELAETCADTLTRGAQVYVEGRLEYRSWTDRNGSKRTTAEVVASKVQLVALPAGHRDKESRAGAGSQRPDDGDDAQRDDDVPF